MSKYEHLLSPIKIGETTVKNRIFMPPLSTNLADKGYVTDELVEHYKARAKGGVGLFVTEVVTVEPTYCYLPGDMCIYDDSFIPGWKKLADGVHEYGAKILPQLFHPAHMAFPLPGTPRLIAPSNVGPYYAKEAPRAVTKEELKVIIRQFGEAAKRAQIAGADGVEIHAAHAHGLLGGFLSPLYNKRTDEYGGDIDHRLRLTLEVIEEVRRVCGKNFIIDVRISGSEYTDGGLNLNDMIYVAKQLEKAGVDFLHVSGGTTIARGSSIPAPGTPMGSHAATAAEIKKYVSIPVATVGRITEPWIAEELIANGKADICMIGRANLCDPEFANKVAAEKADDIRPCIGCLRCLNGIMFGKRVACTVNPSFELENEDTLAPAAEKKNVLVIGSGPAGMEAAFVAAKRGHHVVLCEKEAELGGLMRIAAVPIAKQDLTRLIQYMARRLEGAGVEVRLNCTVDKVMLEGEFKGWEVIAGAGAQPIVVPAFTGFKQWMTADDVLAIEHHEKHLFLPQKGLWRLPAAWFALRGAAGQKAEGYGKTAGQVRNRPAHSGHGGPLALPEQGGVHLLHRPGPQPAGAAHDGQGRADDLRRQGGEGGRIEHLVHQRRPAALHCRRGHSGSGHGLQGRPGAGGDAEGCRSQLPPDR